MQIIVDANAAISLLIKPGKPVDLLFLEEIDFVAPALFFIEIERNKGEIRTRSTLTPEEVEGFIRVLKRRIRTIPEEEFLTYRERAIAVCPDTKDVTYFALALALHCPLWSNEKRLKKQNAIKVYATHELMELFGIR